MEVKPDVQKQIDEAYQAAIENRPFEVSEDLADALRSEIDDDGSAFDRTGEKVIFHLDSFLKNNEPSEIEFPEEFEQADGSIDLKELGENLKGLIISELDDSSSGLNLLAYRAKTTAGQIVYFGAAGILAGPAGLEVSDWFGVYLDPKHFVESQRDPTRSILFYGDAMNISEEEIVTRWLKTHNQEKYL